MAGCFFSLTRFLNLLVISLADIHLIFLGFCLIPNKLVGKFSVEQTMIHFLFCSLFMITKLLKEHNFSTKTEQVIELNHGNQSSFIHSPFFFPFSSFLILHLLSSAHLTSEISASLPTHIITTFFCFFSFILLLAFMDMNIDMLLWWLSPPPLFTMIFTDVRPVQV